MRPLRCGTTTRQSAREVEFSGAIYCYYADNAESLLADKPITDLGGEGSALIEDSTALVSVASVAIVLGLEVLSRRLARWR